MLAFSNPRAKRQPRERALPIVKKIEQLAKVYPSAVSVLEKLVDDLTMGVINGRAL